MITPTTRVVIKIDSHILINTKNHNLIRYPQLQAAPLQTGRYTTPNLYQLKVVYVHNTSQYFRGNFERSVKLLFQQH